MDSSYEYDQISQDSMNVEETSVSPFIELDSFQNYEYTQVDALHIIGYIHKIEKTTDQVTDTFKIECGKSIIRDLTNYIIKHRCERQSFIYNDYFILDMIKIVNESYGRELLTHNIDIQRYLNIIEGLENIKNSFIAEKGRFNKAKIYIEYLNYKRVNFDIYSCFTSKYDEAIIELTRLYVNNYQKCVKVIKYQKVSETVTVINSTKDATLDSLSINPASNYIVTKMMCLSDNYILNSASILTYNTDSFEIVLDELNVTNRFFTKDENNNIINILNLSNENDIQILTMYIMHHCNIVFTERNKSLHKKLTLLNSSTIDNIVVKSTKRIMDVFTKVKKILFNDKEIVKCNYYLPFMLYISCVFAIENKHSQLIESINMCDPIFKPLVHKIALMRSKTDIILRHFINISVEVNDMLLNIVHYKSVEFAKIIKQYFISLNNSGWFHSREQMIKYKIQKEEQLAKVKSEIFMIEQLLAKQLISEYSNVEQTKEVLELNHIIYVLDKHLSIDEETYNAKKQFYLNQLKRFHKELPNCISYLVQTNNRDNNHKISHDILIHLLHIIEEVFENNKFGRINDFSYVNLINATHLSIRFGAVEIYEKLINYIFKYDPLLPNICPKYKPCISVLGKLKDKFVIKEQKKEFVHVKDNADLDRILVYSSPILIDEVPSNESIMYKLGKLKRKEEALRNIDSKSQDSIDSELMDILSDDVDTDRKDKKIKI